MKKDRHFDEEFKRSLIAQIDGGALTKGEVYLWKYENFTDVVERIPQFIETVYNRKRIHSGIHYLPPVLQIGSGRLLNNSP